MELTVKDGCQRFFGNGLNNSIRIIDYDYRDTDKSF